MEPFLLVWRNSFHAPVVARRVMSNCWKKADRRPRWGRGGSRYPDL